MSDANAGILEGGIKLGLEQWTPNIAKSIADVTRASDTIDRELVAAGKRATAVLEAIAKESVATTAGLSRMERELGGVRSLLVDIDRSTIDMANEMAQARIQAQRFGTASLTAFGELKTLLASVDQSVHTLTQHMTQAASVAKTVKPPTAEAFRWGEAFRSLAGTAGMVYPRIGQLVSGLTAVEGATAAFGVSLGAAATGVGIVVSALVAAKTAAGALEAAFAFGVGGVKLAADMEQVALSFEVIIGNAKLARTTLAGLKQFADTTPFEFSEIASAGKQLLAMGIAANDLQHALRMLGDVGSGLGQPLGEMAYLFGQIRSQGRAMTQDLNQFAGRGVPIYSELAKVLGTTELGVRDLAQAGEIGFAQINAAFESMTGQGGKFFEMTIRQAETLNGKISTLSDAWDTMKREVGETIAKNLDLKGAVEAVTGAIAALAPVAVEAFGKVSAAVKDTAKSTDDFRRVMVELNQIFGDYNKSWEDAYAQQPGWLRELIELANHFVNPWTQVKDIIWLVWEGLKKIHEFASIPDRLLSQLNYNANEGAAIDADNHKTQGVVVNGVRHAPGWRPPATGTPAKPATPTSPSGSPGAPPATPGTPPTAPPNTPSPSRRQSDADHSQEHIDEARYAARIARLRAENRELEADLVAIEGKFASKIAGAATDAEKNAYKDQMLAEQALARKRSADEAARDKAAADAKAGREATHAGEQASRDAKQREEEARDSAERTADMQLQAQLMSLRAYGREYEATLLEIEGRLRERLSRARSDGERRAAQDLHDAEVATAAKRRQAELTASGTTATNPLADARHRMRNARTQAERSLAQIDMREALGETLTPEETARRGRLRERTGTADANGTVDPVAAARQRRDNASTPEERSLATIDMQDAALAKQGRGENSEQRRQLRERRERLQRRTGIAPGPSIPPPFPVGSPDAPSNRARAAVDAAANPAGAGGGSPLPPITVNAPNIDETRLAAAIASRVEPMIDRKINAAAAAAAAADHQRRAAGGL